MRNTITIILAAALIALAILAAQAKAAPQTVHRHYIVVPVKGLTPRQQMNDLNSLSRGPEPYRLVTVDGGNLYMVQIRP
jgi:hypothetical protein